MEPGASVELAKQWHRELYRGIELPVPYFAGEVHDSDPEHPELFGYEVRVGRHLGVASRDVPAALKTFEDDLRTAMASVDERLREYEPIDASGVEIYITLVAVTRGEWVRIHPFANGNGRTARLWTHWIAARYDLPPLMRVKPRPNDRLYAQASAASVTGDHRILRAAWLLDQLLADTR